VGAASRRAERRSGAARYHSSIMKRRRPGPQADASCSSFVVKDDHAAVAAPSP
jgi:hypothetical protein